MFHTPIHFFMGNNTSSVVKKEYDDGVALGGAAEKKRGVDNAMAFLVA